MKPYDPNTICPKCGSGDVSTHYVESHTAWQSHPSCRLPFPEKYAEHMDRECRRCHFGWAESALDPAPREV